MNFANKLRNLNKPKFRALAGLADTSLARFRTAPLNLAKPEEHQTEHKSKKMVESVDWERKSKRTPE